MTYLVRRDMWLIHLLDVRLPFDFTLGGCSSLQTLALRCPIALHSKVPWVTALLSDVKATHIETVTLEVRLLGSLHASDWQQLDNILAQDTFKNLRTIEVKVAVWHTAAERAYSVKSIVESQLPQANSRRLLRFID